MFSQLSLPITLRPYQQEGINWLAFLRRFGLHGVLADDMVREGGSSVGWYVVREGGSSVGWDVVREGGRSVGWDVVRGGGSSDDVVRQEEVVMTW